jgi:hypothetical protein
MSDLPVYATEVRYYRTILRVAYETGSRLRKLGILKPDAICDDNRPLFLIDPASIQRAQVRIQQYRVRVARSRHNLPMPTLCPEKIIASAD